MIFFFLLAQKPTERKKRKKQLEEKEQNLQNIHRNFLNIRIKNKLK